MMQHPAWIDTAPTIVSMIRRATTREVLLTPELVAVITFASPAGEVRRGPGGIKW
jgi:hypothetical protein